MISVTTFLKIAFIASVSATTLRVNDGDDHDRHLQEADYAFLVSDLTSNGKSWCITATNGVHDGANLGFRLCDFHGKPANQLWWLDPDGRFHSYVDSNRCMIINFGTDLFDGVRVRMSYCNAATTHGTQFLKFHHNGSRDQIASLVDRSYCVTNRGVNPNAGDTIHAKPCQNTARYYFTYYRDSNPTHTPPTPPTYHPTHAPPPTYHPTHPTGTHNPTYHPTHAPPTYHPTHTPPTYHPTHAPPTYHPTHAPHPTYHPTYHPTHAPHPTYHPTYHPTHAPHPTYHPTPPTYYRPPPTHSPPTASTDFIQIKTDHGCLTYPGANPTTGEGVMLKSCSGQRWRVESHGLIRTKSNTNQCLQAGHGGTPTEGTKMRIYPCHAGTSVQQFSIITHGKINLTGTNLCVDHRGTNGNVGQDPIILKPCGNAGSWAFV